MVFLIHENRRNIEGINSMCNNLKMEAIQRALMVSAIPQNKRHNIQGINCIHNI